ncbi:Sterol regulatory element-binding protein ECM22 [Fusarium austroafricanum]|uniref:Sterol regulatory element-binding protein ECM22 n=1 Tax=Fusarium austroafricanum TaxID=2364996 RepID=A0A8H4KID1_9HYPO|nr:Sterol regulatory element-binding protein ECM22 [Fusarium austroafricanum]
MHGILAIAAAHKAYLLPASRKTYLPLADYHQTLGSEGYRRYLQHLNLTNWMPVFAFASLIVLHMLTLPMRMDNCILEDPIRNLIELAGMLRGIKVTVEPAMKRIVRTEFAPVVFGIWGLNPDDEAERCPTLENSALPTDTWIALQRLRDFQETDIPASGLQHYASALEGLETSARLFAAAGLYAEVAAAHFWLYTIDDSILLDLSAHRPQALLLFAHYLVHWAVFEKTFWFTRGWCRQVMAKIEEGLTERPKFIEMLHWPKQMIAQILI